MDSTVRPRHSLPGNIQRARLAGIEGDRHLVVIHLRLAEELVFNRFAVGHLHAGNGPCLVLELELVAIQIVARSDVPGDRQRVVGVGRDLMGKCLIHGQKIAAAQLRHGRRRQHQHQAGKHSGKQGGYA